MQLPSFTNPQLLTTALTHRSALNEHPELSPQSNERFEFLGDAVLELITTKYLFDKYPNEPEGILTSYRSAVVKTTSLADVARQLGLGEKLHMSRGEEATGGRENSSLLANTFEAVLGALYLDQGFDAADKFVREVLLDPNVDTIVSEKLFKDPKSNLQEVVQALGLDTPTYQVISEVGPDHDKEFTIAVFVGEEKVGVGLGRSKQLAQQAAAEEALKKY